MDKDFYLTLEGLNYGLSPQDQDPRWVHQYCYEVLTDKIPTCKEVKAACTRHVQDLIDGEDRDLYFCEDSADHAISFFSTFLEHVEGEYAGTPIFLLPWQQFIVGSLFGWLQKRKGQWLRRFTRSYCEVPRKNGKSTLSAGIGLYMLFADGEDGAQIYSAATNREQAKAVFNPAKIMTLRSDELSTFLTARSYDIVIDGTTSVFKPLAANAGRLDGLNVHCALIDELHEHPDSKVYDVLETGTGARLQPLVSSITTAGLNKDNSFCYEVRTKVQIILETQSQDFDHFFGIIYTLDNEDEINDPDLWLKANPCLGQSVNDDYIRAGLAEKKTNQAELVPFLAKTFNIWSSGSGQWLSSTEFDKNFDESLNINDYEGQPCFIGIDLASTQDLTTVAVLFPQENDQIVAFHKNYYPEDNIRTGKNVHPKNLRKFTEWADQGHITCTEGTVTDYNKVIQDLKELNEKFDIQEVCYDQHNVLQIQNWMVEEGMTCTPVMQSRSGLNDGCKDLEIRLLRGDISYNNPVFKWSLGNIEVDKHEDSDKYVRFKKRDRQSKIDPVIATVTALAQAKDFKPKPKPSMSVYTLDF